jgi:hypothetical protein
MNLKLIFDFLYTGYSAYCLKEAISFTGEDVSTQYHTSLIHADIYCVSVGDNAAHFRTYTGDEDFIAHWFLLKVPSSLGGDALCTVFQMGLRGSRCIRKPISELDNLVTDKGAASASGVGIEKVHQPCATEKGKNPSKHHNLLT